MANTGGKRITDTFWFKQHAIPVLDITATNRMIDTTIGLTAAIAGIQEAPPNNMEAIQSLCTLLLGKVAPLPPPAPSILPTPAVLTPTVARLGIPIFGSNFWDPHWKRNSGSVSNFEDSGRKIFNQIPLLKNQEIGILILKFGIPKKINVGI
jgi:hypothetical protein